MSSFLVNTSSSLFKPFKNIITDSEKKKDPGILFYLTSIETVIMVFFLVIGAVLVAMRNYRQRCVKINLKNDKEENTDNERNKELIELNI